MRFVVAVSSLVALLTFPGLVMAGEGPDQSARTASAPEAEKEPFPKIADPFGSLVAETFEARMAALAALIEKGDGLAEAALAEAARLRALPPAKSQIYRDALSFVCLSLDVLAAETELAAGWEPGLPESAEKISGRKWDATCTDEPVAAFMERAGKGWGVSMKLSPASLRMNPQLFMALEGAPSLKEFVSWFAGNQGLACGHVGDTIVFVPPCSAVLAARIRKKAAAKQ